MTLQTTTPLSGGGTSALIGGTLNNYTAGFRIAVEDWKFEPNAQLVEFTNTEGPQDGNGVSYYEGLPTKKTTKLTLTFFYDNTAGAQIWVAPVIEAGAAVLITRLWLAPSSINADGSKNYVSMPHYMIPKMYCEGDPVSAKVGDKIMITGSFTITGIWYYPTTTGNSSAT